LLLPASPTLSPLSLHDALPICSARDRRPRPLPNGFTHIDLGHEAPKPREALRQADRQSGNAEVGLTARGKAGTRVLRTTPAFPRSEEHMSELQSRRDLVCRLLL